MPEETDLGEVHFPDAVDLVLPLFNRAESEVTIEGVNLSCGCVNVRSCPSELAAHSDGELALRVEPAARGPGRHVTNVRLRTRRGNEQRSSQAATIILRYLPLIESQPANVILGPRVQSSSGGVPVMITHLDLRDLGHALAGDCSIESDLPWLRITRVPVEETAAARWEISSDAREAVVGDGRPLVIRSGDARLDGRRVHLTVLSPEVVRVEPEAMVIRAGLGGAPYLRRVLLAPLLPGVMPKCVGEQPANSRVTFVSREDGSGEAYIEGTSPQPRDGQISWTEHIYHNIYQFAILQMSIDFFPDDFTDDYGHWRLVSLGPSGLYGGFGIADLGWLYDPTNGVRSRGQIIRTHIEIEGMRLAVPN
ncbi:MAG: DUF1573 domain-containing protein [Candidatus Sumerlaeia bacterium]|nr:DUF1573 domain-containing protein [Candidatus Sumerlaeia bacterium]